MKTVMVIWNGLALLSMIGCAADSSTMASQASQSSQSVMTAGNCPAVTGYENIIRNLNSLIDGYNNQNDAPFKQYLDDNVVMTIFEISGRVRQTNGKAAYLDDLHQSWKAANPKWANVCIWQPTDLSNLVKVPVSYGFTITPASQARRTVLGMAVLQFTKGDEKLIDANYSTRAPH